MEEEVKNEQTVDTLDQEEVNTVCEEVSKEEAPPKKKVKEKRKKIAGYPLYFWTAGPGK